MRLKLHRNIISLLITLAILVGTVPLMTVDISGHYDRVRNATYIGSSITRGGVVHAGQYFMSPNRRFIAIVQGDGNFVIYNTQRALWSTGTSGHGNGCFFQLQHDGNIVLYNAARRAIWSPHIFTAVRVELRDNGNLVAVNSGGGIVWQTGAHPAAAGVFQVDNQFSHNGGLANRAVMIHPDNVTAGNATWRPIINFARDSWNNAGAGTNIAITPPNSMGPFQHRLVVHPVNNVTWRGRARKFPAGNVVATSSLIEINTLLVDRSFATCHVCTVRNCTTHHNVTNARRKIIIHEMGHLFWLGDNPRIANPNNSIMHTGSDLRAIHPRPFDVANVRFRYN